MGEQVGNSRWNPEVQRIRQDMYDRGEPEVYDEDDACEEDDCEEEGCPECGFDPCRCDEIDVVTDALEKRGVRIERGEG
ncbi:MAG: hypothetical protein SVV80_12595 [Planctomycetota bacterium]|nr:hypothetical protein [Planctomycetota bacterium]